MSFLSSSMTVALLGLVVAGCGAEVTFGSSGDGASGAGGGDGGGGDGGGGSDGSLHVGCVGELGPLSGEPGEPPGGDPVPPSSLLLETDCAEVSELRVVGSLYLTCEDPDAIPSGCGWWELRIALPWDYPFANQAKEQGTPLGFVFREMVDPAVSGLSDCMEVTGSGVLAAPVLITGASNFDMGGLLEGFNDYFLAGKPDGHFHAGVCH